jgi:hypothetical protein
MNALTNGKFCANSTNQIRMNPGLVLTVSTRASIDE